MENVNALKALYVALGGSADTVAALTLNAEVINAIATLVGTTGGMLPKVTSTNNGKVLKVVDGAWDLGTDAT
jgi:hypothetical protein